LTRRASFIGTASPSKFGGHLISHGDKNWWLGLSPTRDGDRRHRRGPLRVGPPLQRLDLQGRLEIGGVSSTVTKQTDKAAPADARPFWMCTLDQFTDPARAAVFGCTIFALRQPPLRRIYVEMLGIVRRQSIQAQPPLPCCVSPSAGGANRLTICDTECVGHKVISSRSSSSVQRDI